MNKEYNKYMTDSVDIQKCVSILEKTESQKSDQEKEYIKQILKQTFLFKQLEDELNFQIEDQEGMNNEEINVREATLDIDVLLNRTQRNIKYLRVPKNEFLFHKGDPGDRLYIIIKGNAAVYAERDKSIINSELTKEKTITKQIQLLSNKILHYEHQICLKQKKITDELRYISELEICQQEQIILSNNNEESGSESIDKDIKIIREQQIHKEEAAITQMQNILLELKQEHDNLNENLSQLISQDEEILKQSCSGNKEFMGKYFCSQSTSGNISYYQKLKSLGPQNHLGEASIITNESRTATVMACSSNNGDNGDDCESDEDLHLLYLEANVFIGIFSATLDQINFPLTVLSRILNNTSKDIIVRLSYLFKLNQYKFNNNIFTEGIDLANSIFLIKKGCVQIQRNQTQKEYDETNANNNINNNNNNIIKLSDDIDDLKRKPNKRVLNIKKQVVIAMIGEGQFFGLEDICFKTKNKSENTNTEEIEKTKKRTCSAIALSSSLIYMIPKNILFNSNHQLLELQQKLGEKIQIKQNFYFQQSSKNNQIQNYLENELNRINQQPQIEKQLHQMSMNNHKQLLLDSGKVSNMMENYIKVNKEILNHQKDMVSNQNANSTKNQSDNPISARGLSQDSKLNNILKSNLTTTPQKCIQYGRIQVREQINQADIEYNMMIQAENVQALNLPKDKNNHLSIMPQSQENVKQILRAQRFYSKSKDSHNINIRSPARQKANDSIIISNTTANILSLTNINFKDKSMKNTENQSKQLLKTSVLSLSEFDDTATIRTQTNSNQNKNKKLAKKNEIKQQTSITSTTLNTPILGPKEQLFTRLNSFQNINLQPPDSTINSVVENELQYNTVKPKKKTIFSLSCMKSMELCPKQNTQQNIFNQYLNQQNNIIITVPPETKDEQKIQRYIKLRKGSNILSQQEENDSNEKLSCLDTNFYQYHNKLGHLLSSDQTDSLIFKQTQENITLTKPTQISYQLPEKQPNYQRSQNKCVSYSEYKQTQELIQPEQQLNTLSKQFNLSQPNLLFSSPKKVLSRKFTNSFDIFEKDEEKSRQQQQLQQSPLLISQNEQTNNQSNPSKFSAPKTLNFILDDSNQKYKQSYGHNSDSKLKLQINLSKDVNNKIFPQSQSCMNQRDSNKKLFQSQSQSLYQFNDTQQRDQNKSRQSHLNQNINHQKTIQTRSKLSPNKTKLKPLLPLLSNNEESQLSKRSDYNNQQLQNPFQSRGLIPQITNYQQKFNYF